MVKVNHIIPLSKEEYLLIIEGESDLDPSVTLSTNIGDFSPGEYSIGRYTQCFTEEKAYAIRIHSEKDCMKITSLEFR